MMRPLLNFLAWLAAGVAITAVAGRFLASVLARPP